MGAGRVSETGGLANANGHGGMRGRRATHGGRPHVRAALDMATRVATRPNPLIRTYDRRLVESEKPKMLALVATMRKLLTIIHAMLRDEQSWQLIQIWLNNQESRYLLGAVNSAGDEANHPTVEVEAADLVDPVDGGIPGGRLAGGLFGWSFTTADLAQQIMIRAQRDRYGIATEMVLRFGRLTVSMQSQERTLHLFGPKIPVTEKRSHYLEAAHHLQAMGVIV